LADPESVLAIDAIRNPDLPVNGIPENNHIMGIVNAAGNSPVAWIQFYRGFGNPETLFLGESFVHRKFQNQGIGGHILRYFENQWISGGFTRVEKVIGDAEYSETPYEFRTSYGSQNALSQHCFVTWNFY